MNKPVAILTRTEADNARIASLFESQGMFVRSLPMIEIQNYDVDIRDITSDDPCLVLLTSSRATTQWLPLQEKVLNGQVAGYMVVGQTSVNLLAEANSEYPVLIHQHSIQELLEELLSIRNTDETEVLDAQRILGKSHGMTKVLYPCNARRREEGLHGLRRIGFDVMEIPLYEPVPSHATRGDFLALTKKYTGPLVLPFFSPSAVEHFFQVLVPESTAASMDLASIQDLQADRIVFASIGETTAEALYAHGIEDVIVAEEPKAELLVEAIVQALAERSR